MIPSDFTFIPTKPDIGTTALARVYEEAYQNGADDILEQFIDYLESKGIEFLNLDNDAIVKIDMGDEDSQWAVISKKAYDYNLKESYNEGHTDGYRKFYKYDLPCQP